MNWLDVTGPPGVGKSTLCDPIYSHREIGWDNKLPPAYWKQYLDEITQLCRLVEDHPSFEAVVRMNNRTIRKMATVERMEQPEGRPPYIHVGFIQRITGFGWRLHEMGRDVNLIRPALWRMPVSLGAAFLEASPETVKQRNHARREVAETAHEDRAHMVDPMLPSIEIAKEVLHERGVPVVTIDVEHQEPNASRKCLVDFAGENTGYTPPVRYCREVEAVSPPGFWV